MPPPPPLSNGVVAWLVARIKGCPMVYNVQNLYPDMAVKMGLITNKGVLFLLSGIEKLVYKLSKKVVTISEAMGEAMRAKGVAGNRIQVIENFIDPQPERYVPQIWAAASVGAITYRKQLSDFSVPSKLLACMCAQRPALAAADEDSATTKLIAKAGCGVVVRPESPQSLAETIVWMKERPDALQEMAATGRRYAEKYLRKDSIVDRYESLLQDIASN